MDVGEYKKKQRQQANYKNIKVINKRQSNSEDFIQFIDYRFRQCKYVCMIVSWCWMLQTLALNLSARI